MKLLVGYKGCGCDNYAIVVGSLGRAMAVGGMHWLWVGCSGGIWAVGGVYRLLVGCIGCGWDV